MAKKALDINDIDNAYCGCCQHFTDGYCRETKKNIGFFTAPCDKYVEQPVPVCAEQPAPVGAHHPTKVCSECGRELPLTSFAGHARTADHLQPRCKECMSKLMKGKVGCKRKAERADSPKSEDKPIPRMNTLEGFHDHEIVAELRRRGWAGTICRKEEYTL